MEEENIIKIDDPLIEAHRKEAKKFMETLLTEILRSYSGGKNASWLNEMLKNLGDEEYIIYKSEEYNKLDEAYKSYQHAAGQNKSLLLLTITNHLQNIYEKHKKWHDTLNKTISNLSNAYNKEIKKKLANLDLDIQKKITEIDELLGEIAESSNAAKYKDYAEKNCKAARWLFWFSVAIMGSLSIFSAFALYFTDITSKDLLVRISLFFAILLPAFFMMREAKKLKDKEFQYTDMAHRIITSAPYIDGLRISEEEKDKLKAGLVKDFFARPIECRDDGGLPPIDNICEVIKTCLDSCRKD